MYNAILNNSFYEFESQVVNSFQQFCYMMIWLNYF